MEKKTYTGLDLIKFICSLLIVAIHIPPFVSQSSAVNSALVNGLARIAVPFFFVAGGFFLFSKIDLKNPDYGVLFSYVLKMLRLFVIWNLIFLPFVIRDISASGNIKGSTEKYIQHMFFASGYGLFWYLGASAVAVLFIALLLRLRLSLKKILVIASALYVIGLLGQSYFGLILPLKGYSFIWNLIKSVGDVIITTRNGLFEGVLFIGIGAALSKSDKSLSLSRSALGFIVSLGLLFAELLLVRHFDLRRAGQWDMYISLVPCSVFLFLLGTNINLKSKRFSKSLRTVSTLVYLSHMLIFELVIKALDEKGTDSVVLYLLAVILTVALDVLIILLSNIKGFKFLKHLYR